jgi:hypothetical protein
VAASASATHLLLELLHLVLPLLLSSRCLLLLLGRLFLQRVTAHSAAVISSQLLVCHTPTLCVKAQASVAARAHLLLPVLLQTPHRLRRLCGLVVLVFPSHGARQASLQALLALGCLRLHIRFEEFDGSWLKGSTTAWWQVDAPLPAESYHATTYCRWPGDLRGAYAGTAAAGRLIGSAAACGGQVTPPIRLAHAQVCTVRLAAAHRCSAAALTWRAACRAACRAAASGPAVAVAPARVTFADGGCSMRAVTAADGRCGGFCTLAASYARKGKASYLQ